MQNSLSGHTRTRSEPSISADVVGADYVSSNLSPQAVNPTAAAAFCQSGFTPSFMMRLIGGLDCCPWGATSGHRETRLAQTSPLRGRPLYTADERLRRDQSVWTTVQAILAPVQFMVFLVSLCLVLRYLATGNGLALATASIVLKTLVLYTIMITGSIWERDVFGRFLFAAAFFWEDVVSMLVLALHTAYLIAVFSGVVDPQRQMCLALAAYASYAVNAAQFVLKLRTARRQEHLWAPTSALGHTS
jgi:3-vinyl bacteriochlorophyllide hydratase